MSVGEITVVLLCVAAFAAVCSAANQRVARIQTQAKLDVTRARVIDLGVDNRRLAAEVDRLRARLGGEPVSTELERAFDDVREVQYEPALDGPTPLRIVKPVAGDAR